jgi:hypothetical protein
VGSAFIGDTDRGAWDGDTVHDRAVGPMQFIPATWRAYGIDADGTGVADPFNINDAALAAAHYLCVAGGDLRSPAGQRRAVLAYNHSDSYVDEVLALARAYATGIPAADLPLLGDTTGAVPAPSRTFGGPAAPGPAIGARDTTPAGADTVIPGQQAGSGSAAGAGDPGTGGASGQPAADGNAGGPPAGSGGQPAATGGTGDPATQGGSAPPPNPAPAPAPPNPVPVPAPAPVPPVVPNPPPVPPLSAPSGQGPAACGALLLPACPVG